MRQFFDMLVWLAIIAVVGAVVYFAPRFGHAVAAMGSPHGQECRTCEDITSLNPDAADANP
jgi:hypothetical protein